MPSYSYTPENITLDTLCASVGATFPGNFTTANIISRPMPSMLYIDFLVALTVGEQATLDGIVAANKAAYVPPVPQLPPPLGTSMSFGSDMTGASIGFYWVVNGRSDSTRWTALTERTQCAAIAKGYLTRFAWSSESADATTVIKILVNGIVAATFNLTGLAGVVVLPTPVAVDSGALVAVEYDAGQAPNESNVQVYLEPTNP